jgi:hypothetical protein
MAAIVRMITPRGAAQSQQLKAENEALKAEVAELRAGPTGKALAKVVPTAATRLKQAAATAPRIYHFPDGRKVELISMEEMRIRQAKSHAQIIQASGRIMAGRVTGQAAVTNAKGKTSTTTQAPANRVINNPDGSSVRLYQKAGMQKPTPAIPDMQISDDVDTTQTQAQEADDAEQRFALIELG